MMELQMMEDDELREEASRRERIYEKSLASARQFDDRNWCDEDGWSCYEEAMESNDYWEGVEEDRKELDEVRKEIERREALSEEQARHEFLGRPRGMTQVKFIDEWGRLSVIATRAGEYLGALENSFCQTFPYGTGSHTIDEFLISAAYEDCEQAHRPLAAFSREHKRRKELSAHERIAEEMQRASKGGPRKEAA